MIKTIIAAALLVSPAYAADTASWGDGTAALTCAPPTATVTVQNEFAGGHDATAVLTCSGLYVQVIVDHGPGRDPDHVTIVPPAGFMAIPVDAVIEEGSSARFLIVPLDGALS